MVGGSCSLHSGREEATHGASAFIEQLLQEKPKSSEYLNGSVRSLGQSPPDPSPPKGPLLNTAVSRQHRSSGARFRLNHSPGTYWGEEHKSQTSIWKDPRRPTASKLKQWFTHHRSRQGLLKEGKTQSTARKIPKQWAIQPSGTQGYRS